MMFNTIYYKMAIVLGSILGGLYKIHQIWIVEASLGGIIKIIGVIVILAVVFTPTELLQSEDR